MLTLFEGGIQAQSMDTDCFGLYSQHDVNVIPKHTIIAVDVPRSRRAPSAIPSTASRGAAARVVRRPFQGQEGPLDEHGVVDGRDERVPQDERHRRLARILFDYVYGVLAKSGVSDRAHNLAHMMAGGL